MLKLRNIYIGLFFLIMTSCQNKNNDSLETPFGMVNLADTAEVESADEVFTLDDVQTAGEMIMLTTSGPDTYYDYHGRGMGVQYLLVQRFAEHQGVGVRVELCKDSAEVEKRLADGEADIAVFGLKEEKDKKGTSIEQVNIKGPLADTLMTWYKPSMLAEARSEEQSLLTRKRVKRKIFSPMLDRSRGIISRYDSHFMTYGANIRWDWRLLAAQCYQESCFDPQARSWAGACGLMQIMPTTADQIGLARADIFDPEKNIAAATRYIAQLEAKFTDVPSGMERTKFVLASYNGGYHHIRDAMALAQKYGKRQQVWADVAPYVLGLMRREMYTDPVVKNGYMRGQETVDYVQKIMQRYASYRPNAKINQDDIRVTNPRRAAGGRKRKYDI